MNYKRCRKTKNTVREKGIPPKRQKRERESTKKQYERTIQNTKTPNKKGVDTDSAMTPNPQSRPFPSCGWDFTPMTQNPHGEGSSGRDATTHTIHGINYRRSYWIEPRPRAPAVRTTHLSAVHRAWYLPPSPASRPALRTCEERWGGGGFSRELRVSI